MPPGFTSTLAARLDEISPLPVSEAGGGEEVIANRVWIAPGDFHMRLRRVGDTVTIALDQRDPIWGTRPAADALFPSVAEAYGERSVGVVLTGMGGDGAAGLAAILAVGGRTLAQDRASSVVFGMPGRAVGLGAVERVASLQEMPAAIAEALASLPSIRSKEDR
jgi:two-component system chemotaxis response regulator CheB